MAAAAAAAALSGRGYVCGVSDGIGAGSKGYRSGESRQTPSTAPGNCGGDKDEAIQNAAEVSKYDNKTKVGDMSVSMIIGGPFLQAR
jgi:hypothetical protein